jgi:hypothetical protein
MGEVRRGNALTLPLPEGEGLIGEAPSITTFDFHRKFYIFVVHQNS